MGRPSIIQSALRLRLLSLSSLVCLGFSTTTASAALLSTAVTNADTSIDLSLQANGVRQLNAKEPSDHKLLGQCALKSSDIKAEIAGYAANVSLKQIFYNAFNQRIDAVYSFDLSENSNLRSVTVKINGAEIKADVDTGLKSVPLIVESFPNQSDKKGKEKFYSISIADIEPNASIEVEYKYAELIRYDNEEFSFSFPKIVAARYSAPNLVKTDRALTESADQELKEDNEGNPEGAKAVGTEEETICRATATKAATAPASYGTAINLEINTGVPIRYMRSDTHRININLKRDSLAQVTLKNKRAELNTDFQLAWSIAAEDLRIGCITHSQENDRFFTLVIAPPRRKRDLKGNLLPAPSVDSPLPLASDIKLHFYGLKTEDLYPSDLKRFSMERPIFVSGRFAKASSGKLAFSGKYENTTFHQIVKLALPAKETSNDAIKMMWARAKIASLMAENDNTNPERDKARSAEIESLLTQYHLNDVQAQSLTSQ